MTIGLWVLAGLLAITGIVIAVVVGFHWHEWGESALLPVIITLLITIIVVGATIGVGYWYCNNTAGGARALKDQQSELNNGLYREITITAEDGREIFYYCGKCDIETNSNYILFEDAEGYRQMVYWGITDTIIIRELPEGNS